MENLEQVGDDDVAESPNRNPSPILASIITETLELAVSVGKAELKQQLNSGRLTYSAKHMLEFAHSCCADLQRYSPKVGVITKSYMNRSAGVINGVVSCM